MTAQLTKIRTAAPDALVCWGTNPGPAVVAKNVKQLKMISAFTRAMASLPEVHRTGR